MITRKDKVCPFGSKNIRQRQREHCSFLCLTRCHVPQRCVQSHPSSVYATALFLSLSSNAIIATLFQILSNPEPLSSPMQEGGM